MASGDLPDVITLEGAQRLVDFQQLAEADLLADMTDLWEQYASPLAKEVVGADGQVIFNAVSHGGRMKGIPGPLGRPGFSYSYFWVRQDWLDHLGLQPPRTTEELLEMTRAFTHDDPDGNGEDDTFAMMLDKGLWYRSEGFFWSFGRLSRRLAGGPRRRPDVRRHPTRSEGCAGPRCATCTPTASSTRSGR